MEKEKFLFFSEQYHQWFIWNVIPFSSVSTEKVSMLQSVIFSKCSCNQHYFALLKLNGTHTNFPIDAKWKMPKKNRRRKKKQALFLVSVIQNNECIHIYYWYDTFDCWCTQLDSFVFDANNTKIMHKSKSLVRICQ